MRWELVFLGMTLVMLWFAQAIIILEYGKFVGLCK
jgi:hypothetical protein